MLSSLSKSTLKCNILRASSQSVPIVAVSPRVQFGLDIRKLDDKEKGDEKIFFTKSDGKFA
jgi:hypothetical protein